MNRNRKLSTKTFGATHVRMHRPIGNATKKIGRGNLPVGKNYEDCALWRSGKER